jgi:hypothetical protein
VKLSVEDRFELRELVDSYAMAVDALDVERFGSLWTPDAILAVHDTTGEVRRWQGDAIGGVVAGVGHYLRTFHFMGSHRCCSEGEIVSGQTSCFAHHLRSVTDESGVPARDRVVAIRYDDRYERASDSAGWRFARRDVRILWRMHNDVEQLGYGS